MSFTRFRKPTTSTTTTKPLQERQGNITSLPPTQSRPYKPSHIINDDEAIPLTGLISTRQRSFTMKTLNPRRLSLRLKSRPQHHSAPSSSSSSPSYTSTEHKQRHIEPPAPGSAGSRTDFVYKPVRRTDYTAVVAETQQSQSHSPTQRPVSRYQYNYIPTGRSRYPSMDDHPVPVPAPQSHSRSRARAHYDEESERYARDRDSDLYDDLDEQPVYSRDAERARALASLQARPGREYATATLGAENYTSAVEKQRSRAAKRLTTVMVPDVDEIYDW
ncbi:hypothetical protein BJY00DRAFT_282020 [Aspergillus carlsbadensis]|nr:hypothetical protein BJY00DRAFT_282020 [Aspergillus carlsbadensis]